jgi:hypothetical protein
MLPFPWSLQLCNVPPTLFIFPGFATNALHKQRILVDNTKGVNQENAAHTVRAIAKLLKGRVAQTGDISLVFLWNIKTTYHDRSSKKLAQLVRDNDFSHPQEKTPISQWLRDTLEGLSPDKKPPMLYILTNGIFPIEQPDIAGPINDVYRRGRVAPNSLSVTFVQVGDDDDQKSGQHGLNRIYDEAKDVIKQLAQPSN